MTWQALGAKKPSWGKFSRKVEKELRRKKECEISTQGVGTEAGTEQSHQE